MKEKKEILIKYKFILLGDTQVGKTAIFQKLSKDKFFEAGISTHGHDYIQIIFNDLDVDINGIKEKKSFNITLYDTAGQERYRSVTTNFIKHANGVILIYDITSRNTFDHVDEWLTSIQEVLSDWEKNDYLIMLIGNKLDLANEDETKRQVNIEEVNNKYENRGIMLGGECSAKDFSKSQIEDLFKNFTINLYNKIGNKNNKNQELIMMSKPKKKCC